ncbi:MAG: hypothetical protein R3C11_00635 [Planctomycetaceae bacterium]
MLIPILACPSQAPTDLFTTLSVIVTFFSLTIYLSDVIRDKMHQGKDV